MYIVSSSAVDRIARWDTRAFQARIEDVRKWRPLPPNDAIVSWAKFIETRARTWSKPGCQQQYRVSDSTMPPLCEHSWLSLLCDSFFFRANFQRHIFSWKRWAASEQYCSSYLILVNLMFLFLASLRPALCAMMFLSCSQSQRNVWQHFAHPSALRLR